MNTVETKARFWSGVAQVEIPVEPDDSIVWVDGVGWVMSEDADKYGGASDCDAILYTLDIGLNEDGTWNVCPEALGGCREGELRCSGLDPEGVIDYLRDYGFTSTVLLEGLRSSDDACLLGLACEIEAVLALRALGSGAGPGNN
jgi:hypothetical protein